MVQSVRRGFDPHGDKKVFYKSGNNVLDFEWHSCAVIEGDVWILRTEGDA